MLIVGAERRQSLYDDSGRVRRGRGEDATRRWNGHRKPPSRYLAL